jgi:hypothetical protein
MSFFKKIETVKKEIDGVDDNVHIIHVKRYNIRTYSELEK